MWSRLNVRNRLIKPPSAAQISRSLVAGHHREHDAFSPRCGAIAPAGFAVAHRECLWGVLGPRLVLVGTQNRNCLDGGAVELLLGVVDLPAQPFATAGQPGG